jgi:protein involved in polysaccharide export with SLBB domain/beta-lactamase regulating signal transducer with metallopeptidase domain
MNLTDLLSSPWLHRLGWTLLHSLWEVAAVAAVLGLVLFLARRRGPQARYLAALTAMTVALALGVATFFLVSPPAPALPASGAMLPLAEVWSGPSRVVVSAPQAPPRSLPPSSEALPRSIGTAGSTDACFRQTAPQAQHQSPVQRPWLDGARDAIQPYLPHMVAVWLAGVLALSLWRVGGWIAAMRLRVIGTQPVGAGVALLASRLSRRLKLTRPVRILQSLVAQTPMVIGWLRPVILLPLAAVTGLAPAQLEAILAHELAHIRRYDYLANLLQTVVETLLFYHPAAWWISRRLRQERERCCDDVAVQLCGDRIHYAEALAAVEEVRADAQAGTPAVAARGAGGRDLIDRIRRVLGLPVEAPHTAARSVAGAVAMAALLAVLVGLQVTAGGSDAPRAASRPATRPADRAAMPDPPAGAKGDGASERPPQPTTAPTTRPIAGDKMVLSVHDGKVRVLVDGHELLLQDVSVTVPDRSGKLVTFRFEAVGDQVKLTLGDGVSFVQGIRVVVNLHSGEAAAEGGLVPALLNAIETPKGAATQPAILPKADLDGLCGEIELTLGWNGQKVKIPGPLLWPAEGRKTAEFRSWLAMGDVRTLTFTDSAGRQWQAKAYAKAMPEITVQRPDGTLLATGSVLWQGGPTPSHWEFYDAGGKRQVFKAICDAERTAKGDFTGRWSISGAYVYDSDGTQREWQVSRGNMTNVVRGEMTTLSSGHMYYARYAEPYESNWPYSPELHDAAQASNVRVVVSSMFANAQAGNLDVVSRLVLPGSPLAARQSDLPAMLKGAQFSLPLDKVTVQGDRAQAVMLLKKGGTTESRVLHLAQSNGYWLLSEMDAPAPDAESQSVGRADLPDEHPPIGPTSRPGMPTTAPSGPRGVAASMPAGAAVEPVANSVPPAPEDLVSEVQKEYKLGPTDIVDISIMDLITEGVETVLRREVNSDGNIELALLKDWIKAEGRTQEQLRADIVKAYIAAGMLKNPTVGVTIVRRQSPTFSILGAVSRPGTYALPVKGLRLLGALALSGEINQEGKRNWIYVIRAGASDGKSPAGAPAAATAATGPAPAAATGVIAIDLGKLTDGDPRMNVSVRDGDVVFVPAVESGEFYVMGDVAWPGVYSLTGRRITVKMALAAAGKPAKGDWPEKSILIRRVGEHKEQFVYLNLKALLEGREDDLFLQADDVLAIGADAQAPTLRTIRTQAEALKREPQTQPASRPISTQATPSASSGQTQPATSRPAGSALEFRIAPGGSAGGGGPTLNAAQLKYFMDWLDHGYTGRWWDRPNMPARDGTMPSYLWLPVRGDANSGYERLITGQHDGKTYLLVSNDPNGSMVPSADANQAWGLNRVYSTKDNSNRPVVGFDFDTRGAELFAALTGANLRSALALIVDGEVLSAPTIQSKMSSSGIITGQFSQADVDSLVNAIRRGMPATSQPVIAPSPSSRSGARSTSTAPLASPPGVVAPITFTDANVGNPSSLKCIIRPKSPIRLTLARFTVDEGGQASLDGDCTKTGPESALELSTTITTREDRLHVDYLLEPWRAPDGRPTVALIDSRKDEPGSKEGTPQVVFNQDLKYLTEQYAVLWAVRYVKDGKAIKTFGLVARLKDGNEADNPAPTPEELQQSLAAFGAQPLTKTGDTQPATRTAGAKIVRTFPLNGANASAAADAMRQVYATSVFVVDDRTNTLIVSAPADEMGKIAAAVARLDQSATSRPTSEPATEPAVQGAGVPTSETQPAMTREEAARAALAAKATEPQAKIAVYLVTNTNDTRLAERATLNELELAKDPVLQEGDFVAYDGNTRALTVSAEATKHFPRSRSVWGMPYVVVVEGRRWFLGSYVPLGSSYAPSVPLAEDDILTKTLQLKTPNPDDVADRALRANVTDALKAIGQQPATPGRSSTQPAASLENIGRWIAQLGDDSPRVREAATRELVAVGGPARAALQAAADGNDLERAQRAGEVLEEIRMRTARWAIYLTVDPAHSSRAEKMALGDLKLADRPLLTDEDIEWYDANGHVFSLTESGRKRLLPPAGPRGTGDAFVVVADGNRIYQGGFISTISSFLPSGPHIELPLGNRGAKTLAITEPRIGDDPRGDERIMTALRELGKLRPASQAVERRAVGRTLADFPEGTVLSTPESAWAAYVRAGLRKDANAVVELSWAKVSPAEMERFWASAEPNDLAIYQQAQADSQLVEVHVYKGDLAEVVSKLKFPEGVGRDPYSARSFGRIGGQWKNLGEDRLPTLEAARENFESKKDVLWAHFATLRDKLSGEPASRPSASTQPVRGEGILPLRPVGVSPAGFFSLFSYLL